MGNKKNIFISHNYQDELLARVLKEAIGREKNIPVIWLDSMELSTDVQILEAISKQISSSSVVIVLAGENWSHWQEFEIRKAIELNVPVLAVLKPEAKSAPSPILSSGKIPVVKWGDNELKEYLTGIRPSLDFKEPKIELFESPQIKTSFSEIYQELTEYLIKHPRAMYELKPRQFEELVTYIMQQHGYEAELTQQTRDGGVDIYALRHDDFGSFLTIVDCKKYSENNPVRVSAVREMLGTMNLENASHSMLVTTSRFTADSIKLATREQIKYKLSLKGHADILNWMQSIKRR